MAAPVTGPFTNVVSDTSFFYDRRVGYRQKRPYDQVLFHRRDCISRRTTGELDAGSMALLKDIVAGSGPWFQPLYAEVYNKALSRFTGQLGENAGLGVTFAQWKQAFTMIEARGLQLLAFVRAVAQRSPRGIARALHLSSEDMKRVRRTKYGESKTLGDLLLEYHFGWSPMVNDIYTACEVLDDPLPVQRIKGSAVGSRKFSNPPFGGGASTYFDWDSVLRVRLGADVSVENPNLRLLQQLGLLNPADVIFDAVPWSFVFGWFHNLQDYLQSFTAYAGLYFQRGYQSQVHEMTNFLGGWTDPQPQPHPQTQIYRMSKTYGNGFQKMRTPRPGPPSGPFIGFRPFKDVSYPRALTAIALLVKELPRS